MTSHKTGGDIDAFCNKCKLELAHIIIAMKGAKVAKVQCKTCKAIHAYKSSAPKKRAPSTKTRRTKTDEQDYDTLMRGKDIGHAIRYKSSSRFDHGDVIDHKLFGFGLVTRLLSDNKLEVVFQGGMKTLVHGR